MLKFGVADYGLNVWDGGLYDIESRLLDIKKLGLSGTERLEAVSASDALCKAALYRRLGMDFSTCRGPSVQAGIEWTAGLDKKYVWITPGSLDRDWDDDAIICKYMEGRPNWQDDRWQGMDPKLRRDVQSYSRGEVGLNPDMVALDSFWTIGYHKGAQVSGASPDSQLLCLGIIKRSLLLDVGGWDEGYETAAQATVDLGLRLQACGTQFTLWPHIVQALGYDPKAERTALNAAYDADMQRYKILWEGGSRGRLPIGPDADKPQQWARRVAK